MTTTTFTASVAIIDPVPSIDPEFLDLMNQYADFQEMQRATASNSSYGHRTVSRTTVAETTADVRCRLRSLTSEELEETSREGQIIDDFMLDVPYGFLPAKLRDPKHATDFQVINVRTLSGIPVDEGPFDVQGVRLAAGEVHHFMIRVRRVR